LVYEDLLDGTYRQAGGYPCGEACGGLHPARSVTRLDFPPWRETLLYVAPFARNPWMLPDETRIGMTRNMSRGVGNNGARKHVKPFSLLNIAARAGIMCTALLAVPERVVCGVGPTSEPFRTRNGFGEVSAGAERGCLWVSGVRSGSVGARM
jgi:hypothetical protein